ncbi:hypothetical protein BBK82_03095 [Lentzea guizhouensis]|uniref:Uncharacterized protein n=1 Tax=Lentzea guizhouensis TaxID=1586287 RepID=A0A1B2HBV9_9PSEU|nr:hypothetical protein [Lentzea guizhouensis]ANZ35204.1 hypothetical protein BBK82_03095 [Lentzea guizhouensis]
MNPDDLDAHVLVWGVATCEGNTWSVRAHKHHRAASEAARAANGSVAYYDPDNGWTDVRTKQPIPYGANA